MIKPTGTGWRSKPIEYMYTPVFTAACGCQVYGADDYRLVPCARHRSADIARRVLEAMADA